MTSSNSNNSSDSHPHNLAINPTKKASSSDKYGQKNWYAKLHPIGVADLQNNAPKRTLNLSIFFRIWLAVALVLIVCGLAAFTQLFGYVKPTVQQVIEDTLLDTSKLLAVSLQLPLQSGQLYEETYQRQLDSAFIGMPALTNPSSKSNSIEPQYRIKTYSSFRVYVTDRLGIVVYDSLPTSNNAEGKDYSSWNDVYLTLKGQYGARSTVNSDNQHSNSISSDSLSSNPIMYVAQPINDETGTLIGVVSVGKPVASVLPYLNDTRNRMLITALLMTLAALILAGLVAWWLKQSISLVTQYTKALAEDTKKPYFYLGHELNSLTDTIETMKHRLENKAYVSDYVHTLTHELKSPLTAIRASSELLEDDKHHNGLDNDGFDNDSLDEEDRRILIQTIGEQSIKIQQLIDRLLLLAKVEQPTFKLNCQVISLLPMLKSLAQDNNSKLQQQHLPLIEFYIDEQPLADVSSTVVERLCVYADKFWLVQALQNILDNAIYFAENAIVIYIHSTEQSVTVSTFNDGKLLPDYAITKVFDRYFSLSHQHYRPNITPKKGTGLGLTLVKQVIEHHGGSVSLKNITAVTNDQQLTGVQVSLTLPLTKIH